MLQKIMLILKVLEKFFLNDDFLNSIGNDVIQFKQTPFSRAASQRHMLFYAFGTHQDGVGRGAQSH